MAPEPADRTAAAVRRLHPMRLLLVSDDRGFSGVTSLLLERHGFVVRTTMHAAPVRVAELAREPRARAALAAETSPRPRPGRPAAALHLRSPRARLLVLCADTEAPARAEADRVRRTSPVPELTAAIERCYSGERPRAAS